MTARPKPSKKLEDFVMSLKLPIGMEQDFPKEIVMEMEKYSQDMREWIKNNRKKVSK